MAEVLNNMAELDAIVIHNPTEEDFTHNYNGEPYTVRAGETKPFAKFVAFHLARHLSDKLVRESFTQKELKDQFLVKQSFIYDNPRRRIALYKILFDTDLVIQVIQAYHLRDFVGDMSVYEKFVKSYEEMERAKREKPVNESKNSNVEVGKTNEKT